MLTKFGHACVRIESGRDRIVVDPGAFTEVGAADDATAIFITHEHPDHWTPEQLERSTAPIFTIEAVFERLPDSLRERVTVVTPGQHGALADTPFEVVGEKHATIHPELPHFDNSGYLFEVDGTRIFHPGDSLTMAPDVDVLLLPVSAPWLKVAECIDYARSVKAPRNVAIHDRVYSDLGLGIIDGHLNRFLEPLGASYERLVAGSDLSA